MNKWGGIGIVLVLAVAVGGFVLTLSQGMAPVDVILTLNTDYDGTEIGSLSLTYHWVSKQMKVTTETKEVEWASSEVQASSSPTNQIENKILDYLGEASTLPCSIHLWQDGSWSASFSFLIGGTMPVALQLSGQGAAVNSADVGGEISLLPSGLKSELRSLGVEELDVNLDWSVVISGEFLDLWAANCYAILDWIWGTITRSGSKLLGSIDL